MIDLVKQLLYLGVDKIVENLEKLTTDKQKEEEQKVIEETKEELGPVKVEVLKPMEIKEVDSGVIPYKTRKGRKNANEYNRKVYLRKRSKETPEQRAKRLQYMKDYHRKKKEEKEMEELRRKFEIKF